MEPSNLPSEADEGTVFDDGRSALSDAVCHLGVSSRAALDSI